MAKTTGVDDATPIPGSLSAPVPIDLGQVVANGATLYGQAVTGLVIQTADGRRQRLELPTMIDIDPESRAEVKLSPTQALIVRLFVAHEPDVVLLGKNIADLLEGHQLGNLGKPLAELVKLRVLHSAQGVPGYRRGDRFDNATKS